MATDETMSIRDILIADVVRMILHGNGDETMSIRDILIADMVRMILHGNRMRRCQWEIRGCFDNREFT